MLPARYLSAARKISRLAVGRTDGAPTIETYRLPRRTDAGRPARRAAAVRVARRRGRSTTTSRLDGEYVVKIRLQTNNYNYIKGLADPHDLEVRLDRRAGQGLHGRRQERRRAARQAGAARSTATPSGRSTRCRCTTTARGARCRPRPDGTRSASRSSESRGSRKTWRSRGRAAGRCRATRCSTRIPASTASSSKVRTSPPARATPPSRRRIFTCQPRGAQAEACARDDSVGHRAPRLSPAGLTDRDVADADRVLQPTGRARRRLRGGHPTRARANPRQPGLPVPHRAGPGDRRGRGTVYRLSDVELASRLSFFLWSSIPDDELLDVGGARQAEGSRGARAAGPADAGRSALEGAGRELRRPVAACCATSATSSPDPDLFPDFDENLRDAFQQETELFFESQLREDRSVVELLSAELHVRQRAAGAALRHPERLRQPLPPRDA